MGKLFAYLGATLGTAWTLGLLFLVFCFGGICLHYDIHYWASYAKQYDVQVPWLPCILIGLIPGVGQLSIPAAFITWVTSFFM